MTDTPISGEEWAATLTGAELTEVVQGGNNRKTTTQDIANLALPDGTTGSGGPVVLQDGPTLSGTIGGDLTWSGDQYFKSGRPWFDVIAFGADPTDTADSTSAFQDAINAAYSAGGGIVFVPSGSYFVQGGITLKGNVSLLGANMGSVGLQAFHTDVTILTCDNTWNSASVERLTIYGKGTNGDHGTFGATTDVVVMDGGGGVNCVFRDVLIGGGRYCLNTASVDCVFENVICVQSYGPALVTCTGANWWLRCKFDQSTSTDASFSNSPPYPAWTANTAVTMDHAVTLSGYVIVCTSSGTTGLSAPALANYGIAMSDGTAQWEVYGPSTYSAMIFASGAGENSLWQVDMSGLYSPSLIINSTTAYIEARSVLCGCGITFSAGTWLHYSGSHWAGTIDLAASPGYGIVIDGTVSVGASGIINVAAGVSDFILTNNIYVATITINSGSSDYYNIVNNLRATVSDGGTGAHKTISGNN
jgi:hypothetical protein